MLQKERGTNYRQGKLQCAYRSALSAQAQKMSMEQLNSMNISQNRYFWKCLLHFPLLIVLFAGCNFLQKDAKNEGEGRPVARVGDRYLYQEELAGILPPRSSKEDSTNIINRYVDAWVKKQLLLQSAEENMAIDEANIQKQLQDYRYQLIVYAYEKKYIDENLNTSISDEEINTYYSENIDNFLLKQNIVKGIFVKVSKEAPRTNRIRPLLESRSDEDLQMLKSYSYSFAESYFFEDSVWIDFDEFIYNTPFSEEISKPIQILQKNLILQTADSTHLYWVKINDYKIVDQVSPIEFVRDRIRDILINKRILDLKKQHENQIFQKALEKKSYEIYQ